MLCVFNIFDSYVLKCFEVIVLRGVSVLHCNKKKLSNNELFFICESYNVISPILFTTALTIQLSWELELGNSV